MHWVKGVAESVASRAREKGVVVANGGLSVSGLQHVGRLRGEITVVDTVVRLLRREGYDAVHKLTLYTVDAWKGKEAQRSQFGDPEEARAYTGRPLYMVPDPHGCHANWVEHYWDEFGSHLGSFAEKVDVVTTKELYESDERMKKFVLLSVTDLREKVVETINKYRGEKKLQPGYIPFQPICEKCGRVDTTEALEVDAANYRVRYVCRHCGHEGWQSLAKGKLNWRVEWVGVWYALGVDFEPYGKDHATPGGSRDSCNELAEKVYGFNPPLGLAYEWVGYRKQGKDMGDMGSSDFIGFSPRQWLEVAEGEVLRYIYLSAPPMRRIVLSLEEVPSYYDTFDKAERVYYGLEEGDKEAAESYELALLAKPPSEPPFQLRYLNAMILTQVLPSKGEDLGEVVERLKSTKQLTRELTEYDVERIKRRIRLARRWLELYAPEYYRITVVEEPPLTEIEKVMDERISQLLAALLDSLQRLEVWNEEEIKKAMVSIERTKEEEKKLFQVLYLSFFGRPSGPRIAPYLGMLDRDFVINRLRRLVER
ncbi:lysine--tRNA ligase [Thermofilum pendens]|uniref:Lysine--tRNA ligase n=1 Tax=Thermofilum pendens (strain DSM 2475 / Hrk 5) TaxID=368408 RepID=A1RYA8_THEPD|nr:lysine--tRNA ligase [Thermofilum pendens]ABL78188.1 lysyl-tRNA synthetase [Thermofilum pendens Hrk 5]